MYTGCYQVLHHRWERVTLVTGVVFIVTRIDYDVTIHVIQRCTSLSEYMKGSMAHMKGNMVRTKGNMQNT